MKCFLPYWNHTWIHGSCSYYRGLQRIYDQVFNRIASFRIIRNPWSNLRCRNTLSRNSQGTYIKRSTWEQDSWENGRNYSLRPCFENELLRTTKRDIDLAINGRLSATYLRQNLQPGLAGDTQSRSGIFHSLEKSGEGTVLPALWPPRKGHLIDRCPQTLEEGMSNVNVSQPSCYVASAPIIVE